MSFRVSQERLVSTPLGELDLPAFPFNRSPGGVCSSAKQTDVIPGLAQFERVAESS